MSKLIVCKGLPGSGKSKWAEEKVRADKTYIRVSRDDIRSKFFGTWKPKMETLVKEIQKSVVKTALGEGYNVIIDDTNLNQKVFDGWKEFADRHNISFGVKDFTNVSIEKCVFSDLSRDRNKYVGRSVINKMALKAGLIDWSRYDEIAIFDVDGTLADCEHRRHHLLNGKRNWDAFFSDMQSDGLIQSTYEHYLNEVAASRAIIIVSARPCSKKYQQDTLVWLKKNNIEFDFIFMRDSHDTRDDDIIKEEILSYLPKEKVKIVYDDRPRVIRMWQKNGLTVVDCGTGEEF